MSGPGPAPPASGQAGQGGRGGPGVLCGQGGRMGPSGQAERHDQRRQDGHRGLWAAACTVALAAVAWGAWGLLLRRPELTLQHLDARGADRLRPEALPAWLGVAPGTPLAALDLPALARRTSEHPWVRRATLRRQLPDRLQVDVSEHQPALFVAVDRLWLADADGALFKTFDGEDGLDLPVVTGLGGDHAAAAAAAAALRQAAAVAAAWPEHAQVLGRLEELHLSRPMGWTAIARRAAGGRGITRVHLGHAPGVQLPKAARSLQLLTQKHGGAATVWANGSLHPSRVQVQLEPEPPG